MPAGIRVELVCAWPRRHQAVVVALPAGATVADALAAGGFDSAAIHAVAVFGERVVLPHALHDGDRLELLRPLQVDPREARRRRAASGRGARGRS